jgi:hypothetical protein
VGAVYADDPAAEIEGTVGYEPNPDTELLWYADVDLSEAFTGTLEIDGELETVTYGYNLIEIFDVSKDSRNYVLGLHPQFLPDYDDQYSAEWILGLDRLAVWDGSAYAPISIVGDSAEIPVVYTLHNEDVEEYYLKCLVDLILTNVETGKQQVLSWRPAYLHIPDDVPPVPQPTPTPTSGV